MPVTLACLGCNKPLTFPEEQARILPLCAACVTEMSGHPPKSGDRTTDAAKPKGAADIRVLDRAELAEVSIPVAELVEEPSAEKLLELGPRWRQLETAFAWVRFGVYALIMGLIVRAVAAFFNILFDTPQAFLVLLLAYLMLAAAGFSLFVGQLSCLRVPGGTRARPAALTVLAARILAFGLSLYGAIALWEVKEISKWGGRYDLRLSFALFLGAWLASLLAEFSFVAFLKRVGRFLEDEAVVRHTRRANWIVIAYTVAALVLSAAGIAWLYFSIRGEIETYNLRFPRSDPQPLGWLLSRIADVFYTTQKARPGVALAQLGVSVLNVMFWIALGNQYGNALTSASDSIEAGLDRGAAG